MMSETSDPAMVGLSPNISRCRRIALFIGLALVLLALTVLTGWTIGSTRMTRLAPNWASMKPFSAIPLLCSASAIIMLARDSLTPTLLNRRIATALAAISCLLAGAQLSEDLLSVNYGIDTLFFHGGVTQERIAHPGRVSPATSFNHLLIGISILAVCWRPTHRLRVEEVTAAIVLTMTSISLAGYLYGREALYNVEIFRTISLQTTVALMFAAFAVLLLRPDAGLTQFVAERTRSGWLLRRLLPGAIIVPLAIGLAIKALAVKFDHQLAFSLAVFAGACVVLFGLLVGWSAFWIRRDDLRQRHATRAILSAKIAAERANKAKDEFLGIVSHELRTPLTPAMLHLDLLERNANLSNEVKDDLSVVRKQLQAEIRLIDDLLDVTRIGVGKLSVKIERLNIRDEIETAVNWAKVELASGGPKLSVDLAATDWYADVDALRLQQILVNLLKNAIKFTPFGGSVIVRATNDNLQRLRIEVIDTGRGIHPDALPRLFESFVQEDSTLKRQHGGLGLGLTISRALATLMGGTLSLQSEGRDKGTTATLTLPTVPAIGEKVEPSAISDRRFAPLGSMHVLVVEDHPETREVLHRTLMSLGHTVSVAGTVAAASRLASAESFDLIISDIGLPDGSGEELLIELHSRLSVPAIALSGFGMDEDIRRSKQAGFIEHLVKPIDVDQLIKTIEKIRSSAANSGFSATSK